MADRVVTIGSGKTYSTIALAIAGEDDFQAGEDNIIFEIDAGEYSAINITNYTTTSSHKLIFKAADGAFHNFTRGQGVRIINSDEWGISIYIANTTGYVELNGIAFSNPMTFDAYGVMIMSAHNTFINCMAYDTSNIGFFIRESNNVVINSIAINCLTGFQLYGGSYDLNIYNSIALNCTTGLIEPGWCVIYIKNCYFSNTTNFNIDANSTLTVTTCASSDGSQGTTNISLANCSFTNSTAGSEDVSIGSDSDLIDVGTDLSGDSTYPFDTDGYGNSRGEDWDVGVMEYVSAGNTITGSHTLGGLTQSGSITSSEVRTVSGSHTLGGLTQSGTIEITESNTLSGSHILGSLTHSGDLSQVSLVYKLGLLSSRRMWFAHQSVGNYMTHGPADDDAYGVAAIAADNPGYISVVSEPANIGAIDRGDFAESYNGTNFFPYDKLSDFDYAIRNTFSGGRLDFAIFKFCWVDFYLTNSEIKTTGDADTFWTTYKSTIDDLIADFPNTRFILFTVPVTPNNSDSGNSLREYFSDLIRTEYASQGIVFDLADWESRNASRQLELYGGYRELNAAWDVGDGGHPNNAGSDMLAYELITQLAEIAEMLNITEGSHTLSGLTQSGSLVVGNVNTLSGTHTLTGLTQSGDVTNTPPARQVSGEHTLSGLTQAGTLNYVPPGQSVYGSHTLGGLVQDGTISATIPERTLSGSHTLGGFILSGDLDGEPFIFGTHSLTGILITGSLTNVPPARTISGSHTLTGLSQVGSVSWTEEGSRTVPSWKAEIYYRSIMQ